MQVVFFKEHDQYRVIPVSEWEEYNLFYRRPASVLQSARHGDIPSVLLRALDDSWWSCYHSVQEVISELYAELDLEPSAC
jgi:hypothetical protein